MMRCPIHGVALVPKHTRYGVRHCCKAVGCTVACWSGSTSTPADDETRAIRHQCHQVFDPLWRERTKFKSRKEAYRWLRDLFGLTNATAHIGMFNKAQCERLLAEISSKGGA